MKKELQLKLASHARNLRALQDEMAKYNEQSLIKAAKYEVTKPARIKYAALKLAYALEKQALVRTITNMALNGIKGGAKGLWSGLKGMYEMGNAADKALNPHIQRGLASAGRAVSNTIKARPLQSAAGMAGIGYGASHLVPAAGSAVGAGTSALYHGVTDPVVNSAKGVYNTFAGKDPKKIESTSATSSDARPFANKPRRIIYED